MPKELPPPSTITPDDLWIIAQGSPRNPRPVPATDGLLDSEPWMVLTSRKAAQDLAREQSKAWGLRAFALPLTEFLARRYDRT